MSAANVLDHLVAELGDERVELQVRRERLADAVDDLQLGRALVSAGLVDQAGVLEGDAQAGRQGGQESPVSDRRRRPSRSRFWSKTTPIGWPPERSGANTSDFASLTLTSVRAGCRTRRACRRGHRSGAARPSRGRGAGTRIPRWARRAGGRRARWRTGSGCRPVSSVEDADVHDVGVEDLVDLVADEVVHRLHVELRGEATPGRCSGSPARRCAGRSASSSRRVSSSSARPRSTARLEAGRAAARRPR